MCHYGVRLPRPAPLLPKRKTALISQPAPLFLPGFCVRVRLFAPAHRSRLEDEAKGHPEIILHDSPEAAHDVIRRGA